MDSGDSRCSATFGFVVKNFIHSVKKRGIFSHPCMIRNIPWKLCVSKEDDSKKKNVGIYLHCMADDEDESDCVCKSHWACSAEFKISILNFRGENLVRKYDYVFHSNYDSWGSDDFISWQELTNPQNGYIEKNTVYIRAEVKVDVPVGIEYGVKDDDESDISSELLKCYKKIESLESEVSRLKRFEAMNDHKLDVLRRDLTTDKSDLTLLKKEVADENAKKSTESKDMQSKIENLEKVVADLVLQINEMKNAPESVPSTSTNSSTGDIRSEVRDVMLAFLLGDKM